MPVFEKSSLIHAPAQEVFDWHSRPGAFERLIPPWQKISVELREGGIADGARLIMVIHNGPVRVRWEAGHTGCLPGREFTDFQISGPMKSWRHRHRFIPQGPDSSTLDDHIEYELRGGPLGRAAMAGYTRRLLARMFRFRHAQTERDLLRHLHSPLKKNCRVVISGVSGLIGVALGHFLEAGGHRVFRLVRRAPDPEKGEIGWDPARGEIDAAGLEGADAVVHLAGESVAGGRWTPERRERILSSRVNSTRLLAETLARLHNPPPVLVSASAIGFYGDCAEDVVCTEDTEPGAGFLARVCKEWEGAAAAAEAAGIRVVNLRIGVVLAARGGMLKKMLLPFSLGLGGPMGTGRQLLSWVAVDDVIGAIHHLLAADSVSGPVNLAAPNPVTNADFAKTLARVLRRPAFMRVPGPVIKKILGDMGEEVIIFGNRVLPRKLLAGGFEFLLPDLESALRDELGKRQED